MYKYQLLYVFINAYQSGGFMWYAVFDRSMLVLVCGVFTLLCYLAIRQTFSSGPFYAILPLPLIIVLFWRHCNSKFKVPAKVRTFKCVSMLLSKNINDIDVFLIIKNLSLERAIEIDKAVRQRAENDETVPHDTFSATLFRQPAMAEGRLKPASYRTHHRPSSSSSSCKDSVNSHNSNNGYNSNSSNNLSKAPSATSSSGRSVPPQVQGSERVSCVDHDFEQQFAVAFDEDELEDHYEREAAVDAFLNDSEPVSQRVSCSSSTAAMSTTTASRPTPYPSSLEGDRILDEEYEVSDRKSVL
jgi:hypothetical protein